MKRIVHEFLDNGNLLRKKSFFLSLICAFFLPLAGFGQVEESEVPAAPVSEIEFEELKFDFGAIKSGEVVTHVYKFTNTGDQPLIIENAKPSCGCTVPYFPKVAIMPGESSEIQVSFDSKNKKGVQRKSVTITTNTEPRLTILTFSGEVLPEEMEKGSDEWEAIAKQNKEREAIEILSPNCFSIFPNPASHELQLDLKDHIGMSANVTILNEAGQKVLQKRIERISHDTTRFDVSGFAQGIYRIMIQIDNGKPLTQCFMVSGN